MARGRDLVHGDEAAEHGTMRLTEVPTPALLLDKPRFEANCARMLAHCRALGVRLRPHMKTLKAYQAALIARDGPDGGVAASTLNEAEYWAGHGFADIQYAVCVTPDKLPRCAAILEKAGKFSFFLDSIEMAHEVVAFAREHGARFRVWIEVETGGERTGVRPDDPALVEIGRVLSDRALVFEGVATHAGQSYAPGADLAAVAEAERVGLVAAAERLEAAGIAVRGRSAGSTPTAVFARSAEGLTEYRAGVYMAGDLYQAGIGSIGFEDIAVSVLATVISRQADRGRIVVDAGGLALSKDRSTRGLAGKDAGYGAVCGLDLAPLGLTIDDVHQEHGVIGRAPPEAFDRLPIGARVRILPNHACMTAAAYESLLVVKEGRVMDEWDRTNRW